MRRVVPAPTGSGSPDRFTGEVWVDMIAQGEAPSRLQLALVHFAPGAHTAWHRHALGQTLYGVDGVGIVHSRDGKTLLIRPGETVHTPPGEWHWHGALPDRLMAHIAAGETTHDPSVADVDWAEHVTDAEYEQAIRATGEAARVDDDVDQ